MNIQFWISYDLSYFPATCRLSMLAWENSRKWCALLWVNFHSDFFSFSFSFVVGSFSFKFLPVNRRNALDWSLFGVAASLWPPHQTRWGPAWILRRSLPCAEKWSIVLSCTQFSDICCTVCESFNAKVKWNMQCSKCSALSPVDGRRVSCLGVEPGQRLPSV